MPSEGVLTESHASPQRGTLVGVEGSIHIRMQIAVASGRGREVIGREWAAFALSAAPRRGRGCPRKQTLADGVNRQAQGRGEPLTSDQ